MKKVEFIITPSSWTKYWGANAMVGEELALRKDLMHQLSEELNWLDIAHCLQRGHRILSISPKESSTMFLFKVSDINLETMYVFLDFINQAS